MSFLSIPLWIAGIVFPAVAAFLLTRRAWIVRFYSGSYFIALLLMLGLGIVGGIIAIATNAQHYPVANIIILMVVVLVIAVLLFLSKLFRPAAKLKWLQACVIDLPSKREKKVVAYVAKHQLFAQAVLEAMQESARAFLQEALTEKDIKVGEQNVVRLVGVSADMAWLFVSAFVENKIYYLIVRYQYGAEKIAYSKFFMPKPIVTSLLPEILKLPMNRKKYATSSIEEAAKLNEN